MFVVGQSYFLHYGSLQKQATKICEYPSAKKLDMIATQDGANYVSEALEWRMIFDMIQERIVDICNKRSCTPNGGHWVFPTHPHIEVTWNYCSKACKSYSSCNKSYSITRSNNEWPTYGYTSVWFGFERFKPINRMSLEAQPKSQRYESGLEQFEPF